MATAIAMVAVVVGLLATAVQPSMQQDLTNPLFGASQKTVDGLPTFGLIVTSTTAEKALNDSGIFVVEDYHDLFGRRFVVGTISGAKIVYVKSANRPSVNVGLTVQMLINFYNVSGIIQYGSAGGVNNSLPIGTVVAPGRIAFTGIWTWKKFGASNGELVFGKYNSPVNGDNLLGSVDIGSSEVYSDGKLEKNAFWLTPHERWLWLAGKIEGVVAGVKGVSSDIYVQNYAYRQFLWHQFRASIVDTTSSAIALTAYSNDKPFIIFRGVANTAGASDESNGALANANAVKAVERFIFLATVPRLDSED